MPDDQDRNGSEQVTADVGAPATGDGAPTEAETLTGEVVPATGPGAGADDATRPSASGSNRLALGVGSVVGPYTLTDRLGEGGFGVVFLADQTAPVKRRVAFKVIKRGMDTDAVVSRFEAERQALAVMDHPGVAKVLDGGTTPEGLPYFVMEYVAGEAIAAYCDRRSLSLEERVGLFIQVCEAVQHAHQKGIVHRDLKPANILVAERDGAATAKVIDFGIAKALDQRLTEKTFFTEEGLIIGTPEYMSPEQAGMAGVDIDTRTDVYALGVVLYQLLTSQLPFDAKSLRSAGYHEIQRIIREVAPPRPSTRLSTLAVEGSEAGSHDPTQSRVAQQRRTDPSRLRRRLRADLDWVVMKCLEKDRDRRYSTATELADELRRFLGNEPLIAGPPSVGYRLSKFVRRHRAGVAGGGVIAATVIGAAVVSSVFWGREAAAREREAEARQTAERERAVAETVNDFLNNDLLGAPDPLADGPDVRVVDVLRRATDRIEARFADEPVVRARVLGTLGEAFVNIGSPGEAIPLLESARANFAALDLEASPKARAVGLALSEALWRRDRFDEALPIAEAVLATWPAGDPGERAYLDAQLQYANALKYAGRIDEAEALYTELAEGFAGLAGPDAAETWWVRYDLALIDVERYKAARAEGRAEDADRFIRSGLAQMRAAHVGLRGAVGPDDPRTITAASEVAAQMNRLDMLAEAEPLYREVIAAMRDRLGDDHFRTLLTLVNFGRLQQKRGAHAEAVALLEEGLAGFREDPGPASPDTLLVTRFLAESLEAVNQPGGAIDLYERAHAECVAAGETARSAAIAGRLADLHGRLGNAAAAERWRAVSG